LFVNVTFRIDVILLDSLLRVEQRKLADVIAQEGLDEVDLLLEPIRFPFVLLFLLVRTLFLCQLPDLSED
jgi:hypothetical protein